MESPRNTCVIEACRRLNKGKTTDNGKISLFLVPKSSFQAFQACIPTVKLSSTSRLCSRHFDDDDIVKGKTIQGVFYPNLRWYLKPGAIPKHLLKSGIIYTLY